LSSITSLISFARSPTYNEADWKGFDAGVEVAGPEGTDGAEVVMTELGWGEEAEVLFLLLSPFPPGHSIKSSNDSTVFQSRF
jgi:hypothetical protein